MLIRRLTDNDFKDLTDLYLLMGKSINPQATDYQIIFTLISDVSKFSSFIVLGLYIKDKLTGFSCGYGLNNETFYFSGFYNKKNNRYTKQLMEASFKEVKEMGYLNCEIDTQNKNMASMFLKFNAVEKSVKYTKEL